MRRWRSAAAGETFELGRALARELVPDRALLLTGELGSGKTVLVQGLAAGLGLDPGRIQSPTFTLLAEHRAPGVRLLHFDLYRLEPGEVSATGFEELLSGGGVKAVEWAERLPFEVPGAMSIRIRRDGEEREIEEIELAAATT
jgi:tRNA threonylcarbamoyladenosine biosynthesis protein TsaE